MSDDISSAFSQIQGNILGGFNKDFQDFIFLKFKSAPAGRAWIAEVSSGILAGSSSQQVLKFNGDFRNLRKQGLRAEDFLQVAWTNLALTFKGLQALDLKNGGLDGFPADFKAGMAARASVIGDTGPSAPSAWTTPFAPGSQVHAVLIVAADTADLLKGRVDALTGTPAFKSGAEVVGTVPGRARLGCQNGHEHFGFKDGVSQPGIRGVTVPDDPLGNPDQGNPGQDLLWAGEFVLGYPRQIPTAKPGFDGPNPDRGPISVSGPGWTKNGSYLVFRRLDQDVPAFDVQIAALAKQVGLSSDVLGAKLVGRYKSGCPLEPRFFGPAPVPPGSVPSSDPGICHPALADGDSLNNAFEFGDDAAGAFVPRASHIRKTYPRDEDTGAGDNSESETQTHRLLRRGIAFGGSIGDPVGGSPNDKRGLLFVSYGRSIEDQFEFVQTKWVNDPTFPPKPDGLPAAGQDPIIPQTADGPFNLRGKDVVTVKHFVTTSGGDYFFQPSIAALQQMGAGTMPA